MKKTWKKVAPACFGATFGAQAVRSWNHIGTINWLIYPFEFLFSFLLTTTVAALFFWAGEKIWNNLKKKDG